MRPIYLGVDVAGAANTWMAALAVEDGKLALITPPSLRVLKDVLTYCEKEHVVAVAIDAQLTIALSEDTGFRSSDLQLRSLLPSDCKNWVASINSLMAVPIRGRLLADALAPVVGTILETHPRASLYLGLPRSELIGRALRNYKKGVHTTESIATLWQAWSTRFHITAAPPSTDGAFDAIVCATIAFLFHHAPQQLLRLPHQATEKTGRGPFYVLTDVIPQMEVE